MNKSVIDFTSNDPFNENEDISSTTDFAMPVEVAIKKRPYKSNQYGEPPAKRPAPSIQLGAGFKWNLQALSQAANAVQSGGKSPVSALNELGVRVAYSILRQAGPAHCPSFTVAVTVADMTFEGWGHSKREARAAAARACLTALLARAGRVLAPPNNAKQDFTADELSKCTGGQNFDAPEPKVKQSNVPKTAPVFQPIAQITTTTPSESPSTSLFGAPIVSSTVKSAINLLYENYPGLTFTCTHGDGTELDSKIPPLQLSHSMRFKVVCQIRDQVFEGYGSSKKLAKLAAARAALAVLDDAPSVPNPTPVIGDAITSPQQMLYDRVSKLVNEKFNDLMRDDLIHSKRKVLAGIVISYGENPDTAKVIAVTTGTKCISGGHMSVRGLSMNDCHAEVAARRCLLRHLYAQLAMYAHSDDPSQPIPESDVEPVPGGGFRLKPQVQVHLYVSTAPCGDGRIFSPHEPEPDRHPNRLARGQLRTKIESGEGTIPVKNSDNVMQTWDGVMQGERLLTMSCSDKVARWCVNGVQGSLLSLLLEPVYFHCIVLGSLLHPHHMYRAVYGRIEGHINMLPPPFRLNRPVLARAASIEPRTPARAPSFSVCWTAGDQMPEVINATTGKLENGQPSILCKQSMFARWQYLIKRLPLLKNEKQIMPLSEVPKNAENMLYSDAKQLSPAYQEAKTTLYEAFDRAKLGRWVKKPLEQDQFHCELLNADPKALFAWAHDVLDTKTLHNIDNTSNEPPINLSVLEEQSVVGQTSEVGLGLNNLESSCCKVIESIKEVSLSDSRNDGKNLEIDRQKVKESPIVSDLEISRQNGVESNSEMVLIQQFKTSLNVNTETLTKECCYQKDQQTGSALKVRKIESNQNEIGTKSVNDNSRIRNVDPNNINGQKNSKNDVVATRSDRISKHPKSISSDTSQILSIDKKTDNNLNPEIGNGPVTSRFNEKPIVDAKVKTSRVKSENFARNPKTTELNGKSTQDVRFYQRPNPESSKNNNKQESFESDENNDYFDKNNNTMYYNSHYTKNFNTRSDFSPNTYRHSRYGENSRYNNSNYYQNSSRNNNFKENNNNNWSNQSHRNNNNEDRNRNNSILYAKVAFHKQLNNK